MRKVYVSGALTHAPNPGEVKGFYEAIGRLCREKGLEPYVPHLNTDPVKHPQVTPREVYKTDKHHVSTSDLIISYVGLPSIGVGIEIGWAETLDIPVILLFEENERVSRLARGIPNLAAEIRFRDFEHALALLGDILEAKGLWD